MLVIPITGLAGLNVDVGKSLIGFVGANVGESEVMRLTGLKVGESVVPKLAGFNVG